MRRVTQLGRATAALGVLLGLAVVLAIVLAGVAHAAGGADAVAVVDPGNVLLGAVGALLSGLTGVQIHRAGEANTQLAGLRTDFQAYRADQDARMKKLEDGHADLAGRIAELEDGAEESQPRRAVKSTGSHSTTRGRRPVTRPSNRRA